MSYQKQHELGLAGLALLRTWLVGESYVTKHIIDELKELTDDKLLESKIDIEAFDIDAGYKRWSETYDSFPNLLIEVEEPIVNSLLKNLQIGNTLDAGCGTGRYSKILHSLGHSVIGMDLSDDMLLKAKIKNPNINFIRGDLTKIPLKNQSTDNIVSALTLTHLSDLNKAISEFTRILKAKGQIIISDINPWIIALGGQADFYDSNGEYGYIRNYVHWHSNYIKAFQKNNLKIVQCVEPTMEPKHLKLAQRGFDLSLTTIASALQGLPIALVWVLEKI